MSKLIENYLVYLNEKDDLEKKSGIVNILNSIFSFFGFGRPRHPVIKTLNNLHDKCVGMCARTYKPKQRTTSREYGRGEEVEQSVETSIEENPEFGACATRCRIQLLRSIRDALKTHGKAICDKNINKTLCYKWLDKNLPVLEEEIKFAESAFRDAKGESQVSIKIEKLKKLNLKGRR